VSGADLNGDTGRDLGYAASFLGVSKFTVRALVRRRAIEHFRIGRRLVFKDASLRAYMERCRVAVQEATR